MTTNKLLSITMFIITMLIWLLIAFFILWPLYILCVLTYPIYYIFTKKRFKDWYNKWENKLENLV